MIRGTVTSELCQRSVRNRVKGEAMTIVSVAAMAAHIEDLCETFEIAVGSHASGGRAWRKTKVIKIRPVKSAVTYAVALHEIGHVVGTMQSGTRLIKETGAWLWARGAALCWTPVMHEAMVKRLRSYLRWATHPQRQARRHGKPAIPPKDHALWSLVGDIEVSS